jgi:hypothetical protein
MTDPVGALILCHGPGQDHRKKPPANSTVKHCAAGLP